VYLLVYFINYLLDCLLLQLTFLNQVLPVPVAVRSKMWICGRSPAETVDSNPTGGMDVCLL